MTEEYAPEEPEYDPDYEPEPDDGIMATEDRPEPEDRRDPPATAEETRQKSLAWVRKIRAENELPTKPNIRSGRD